jgi:hypothetical protein
MGVEKEEELRMIAEALAELKKQLFEKREEALFEFKIYGDRVEIKLASRGPEWLELMKNVVSIFVDCVKSAAAAVEKEE